MPALKLRNNDYSSKVEFKQVKPIRASKITISRHTYSREMGSRAVSEEQSLSSFAPVTAVLESLFAVQDNDIYAYIKKHPELYAPLLRARAEIYWAFGRNTGAALRMERDPEEEYGTRMLIAIRTTLNAAEAIALLDKLDDAWWLAVNSRLRSLMKIDVEYV